MQENSIIINEIAYNLDELEAFAWQLLVRGGAKSKDGFHTMTVATVDQDGLLLLRTVVLRKASETTKSLFFHTDARSRKFADLEKQPKVTVLLYDPHRRIQMMLKMTAVLHVNNDISDERWVATNAQSRLGYMTLDAPNTPSITPTVGYEARFANTEPTSAESEPFRKNFAVIECQATVLEFLFLNRSGNRKAVFQYENGACTQKNWRVP